MNDITVRAKFKVLTEAEGGKRHSQIFSKYRPNHIFEWFEDGVIRSFIGEITFVDREQMLPGDEAEVMVRFMNDGDIERYIQVDREWFINEGPNRIGIGVILEILN